MVGPISADGQSDQPIVDPIAEPARRDQPMDDEEKILANRPDANIPAFLTRDVLGG